MQANIEAGLVVLDVDASGAANGQDALMLARYFILRARRNAITNGLTVPTSADGATVQANIEALL